MTIWPLPLEPEGPFLASQERIRLNVRLERFDTGSELDWRLQGAGLTLAIVLTGLPEFFGPDYNGSLAAFSSSWNALASTMKYLVIASLVLVILGIVWRGQIERASAWIQMFISFGLGCWMLIVSVGVGFISIDFRALDPATGPARNVLAIGLLIPVLSFVSSLAWLLWDGRHRLQASGELSEREIRRRLFEETSQSLTSAIVTPLMLMFGGLLIVSTSGALQIVAAGVLALSILVAILQVSCQRKV